MRIWSLHPKYLDAKGLVALWRETLLAQNVLLGKTKGYKNHPQLLRFKEQKDPAASVGEYLRHVYLEAKGRGYNFDNKKIKSRSKTKITVTEGQMEYEFFHLKNKLKIRDLKKYEEVSKLKEIHAHPIFKSVKGGVEEWEKV